MRNFTIEIRILLVILFFSNSIIMAQSNTSSILIDKNSTNLIDDFEYEKDERTGGYGILGYNGNERNITIPTKYHDTIITTLFRFGTNKILESIVIPNTVTFIGDQCFSGCDKLTDIVIPDNVTFIAGWAFCRCIGLKNITLSKNLRNIDIYTFLGCKNLEKINIPQSVTTIHNLAFEECSNMQNIFVDTANPNYCSIDGMLFNKEKTELIKCPEGKIGKITIPDNMVRIAENAFGKCSKLTDIFVDTANPNYCSIDGILFNKEKTELIKCPEGKVGKITIPRSMVKIVENAFGECRKLTDIFVDTANPNYCSIDGMLFNKEKTEFIKCPANKKGDVTIPNMVKKICKNAFQQCNNLSRISIPESVQIIEIRAFEKCSNLTHVDILNKHIKIEAGAFLKCTGLKNTPLREYIYPPITLCFF